MPSLVSAVQFEFEVVHQGISSERQGHSILEDPIFSFDIRDAHGEDQVPALDTIRAFYQGSEIATGFCEDWTYLLKCAKPSKLQKLVFARVTPGASSDFPKGLMGHVACAWVSADFIKFAKTEIAKGKFAFLSEYAKHQSPVMSAEALREANRQDGGVHYWVLFLVRSDMAPPTRRLVRQKLFHVIEQDVLGWNIESIHVQVYGEDHHKVAVAHGFRDVAQSADASKYLMGARREEVGLYSETKVVDRFFSWKEPIYKLTEMEKRIALLRLRGYDVFRISEHLRKKGEWTGNEKQAVERAREYCRSIERKVHGSIAEMSSDVFEHLRHNVWELRPSPPTKRKKRGG